MPSSVLLPYQVKKLHWSFISLLHPFKNTLSSGQDTDCPFVQDFRFLFPRTQTSSLSFPAYPILSLCRVRVASRTSLRKPSINLFRSSTFLNTISLFFGNRRKQDIFTHYISIDTHKCSKLKVQLQDSFQMNKLNPIKKIKPLLWRIEPLNSNLFHSGAVEQNFGQSYKNTSKVYFPYECLQEFPLHVNWKGYPFQSSN